MRFVLCLALLFCFGQDKSFAAAELNGHFKSLNLKQQSIGQQSDTWLSANSLRFDLTGQRQTDAPVWSLSVEQLLLYQDPRESLSLPDYNENRMTDLAWHQNQAHELSWQLQVDRLSLRWDRDDKVLTLGRQAIGFGRISLFSPLDIIAPFSPTALDSEVRPGVDALRTQYYFGIVGEIGGTLVLGDKAKKSSALVDVTMNAGQVDMLLMGGRLRDRPMVGVGLAGQLGGLGWKGEWAGYRGTGVGSPDGDLSEQFSIGGIEFEYRFPFELILQTQYLYNGSGSDEPEDYPRVVMSASNREGLSFLSGKHYLLSGVTRNLTPLIDLSGLYIVNLTDDSWLFRPLLALSMANNISLEVFCNFYQGKSSLQVAGLPVPRSEFGSLGDGGGLLLRLYF